jgi:isochorismate synthase
MSNSQFLIFSLPNSNSWYQGSLSEGSNHEGSRVTIQPYQGEAKVYGFAESEFRQVPLIDLDSAPSKYTADKTQHKYLVSEAMEVCKFLNGKIVISRCVDVDFTTTGWNPQLLNLRSKFPAAFVYLLHCEAFGTWLGATPETLVKKSGEKFKTHAVAGTKWDNDPFTQKEFEEQNLVVEAILKDLELESKSADPRRELSYGSIRHLETKIKWESSEDLENVAYKLHPTPAVNGWPKKEATEFILQEEGYDRELYTGFIALNIPKITQTAFVNLRCMQLFRDRIRFYVGGGINALSDPDSEWEESEKKMNSLLDVIQIDE